ncbi:l-carnitine dehydratase bile acid-inducible protein f [Moniliophthora roreri]|nr:l-carnitine dehydratase bile acid-inducible protein f [Moniliophthora roreri]
MYDGKLGCSGSGRQGYEFVGTTPVRAEPAGPRIYNHLLGRVYASSGGKAARSPGQTQLSRRRPISPVMTRTVPNAACKPATESPRLRFGLTGRPDKPPVAGSGNPLTYRNPDSASHTEA